LWRLARKTAVVFAIQALVPSVEFGEQRTLSMGDMAESVSDAPTQVVRGWSR
jgi:hypothetical protein